MTLLLFSVQQSNLQSHINAFHEGHKPFKCTHDGCSSAFAFKVRICIHFHLQGILKIVYGSTKINDCYCTLIVISHFHYILGICEAHNSVV